MKRNKNFLFVQLALRVAKGQTKKKKKRKLRIWMEKWVRGLQHTNHRHHFSGDIVSKKILSSLPSDKQKGAL